MPNSPPISPKKLKWAKSRSDKTVLRGTRLNYNVSQQLKYKKALKDLVDKMTIETKKSVINLFESKTAEQFFAEDESISSKAKKLMKDLTDKFTQLFNSKAKGLAETMVKGMSKVSESTLNTSLKQLSGGLSLKTGVVPEGLEVKSQAIVQENVNLISSIPKQYLDQVSGSVFRSITTGNGLKDLVPAISKFTGEVNRRTINLALDQTRKAYNTINRERLQKLGVQQFEWVHSGGGQHPRPSHVAMSGNIYSWDDLPIINKENLKYESPQRGIPGQAINCKCVMNPVVKFDDGELDQ